MANLIASSEQDVVVGMGATGFSIARFLRQQGRRFVMLDTRTAPPQLAQFQNEFPDVHYELGALADDLLLKASRVLVSPGIATNVPPFTALRERGIPVIGDIQLFIEASQTPLIAITGSNAKSTVTTLVGEMVRAAGLKAAVGGNLGTPALELLMQQQEHLDFVVLELSSFQLETTLQLNAEVATVLNICHDHMDRYGSLPEYHKAKQRIYFGAKHMVVNRDDPLTLPPLRNDAGVTSFGLNKPDLKDFGLIEEGETVYLAQGLKKLMPVKEMKLSGAHNAANALAALAIGNAIRLAMPVMLDTLRNFQGLPHRCQRVAELNQVEFYNDSKGTNVGATVAAINGLARPAAKLVLIAGGEGKGADFSPLREPLKKHARAVVLIGRDASLIEAVARQAEVPAIHASSMVDAVARAANAAQAGDAVLLSPACASFDMFNNYEHRGEAFVDAVNQLL